MRYTLKTCSSIATFFDREAPGWDAAHGPRSNRAADFAVRASYLRKLCAVLGRPRVIDLGCGTGWQLIDLAECIAGGVGLDIAPGMVGQARANAASVGADISIAFHVGDSATAKTENLGRFQLAMCVGSFEHMPDQGAALVAAARLLDEEGRFVVIMPHPCNPGILRSRWFGPRFEVPLNHLTPRGLTQLARAVGLRLVACEGMPYGGFGRLLHRWPFMAGAYAACFALA